MDKATPKDVFQANRDRAAPLLKQLRADGIGHMIDGKVEPSISGDSFETRSPIDGAVLATVARGNAEDIDRAATAAALAFKAWRDMPAADAEEAAASRRRRHRGPRRRYRRARMHRHRPGPPFHGQGRDPRRGKFSLLRRQMRRGARRPQYAQRRALEYLDAGADRPGRRHHAVEYAVHAVDLEDRPCPRRRLHRGAQAGGMVAGHGRPAGETGQAGRRARRRAQYRAWHRRGSRQGADRASRHQGDRFCRRKLDGIGDHGAGRADLEAGAFRTRRQEPGDRVRRRRPRPRARCRRVHDLLAERRALHLVEPAADPAGHRGQVHREADRAGEGAEGRSPARSRDRNRAADPRAASRKGLLLFRRRPQGRRDHRRRRQTA